MLQTRQSSIARGDESGASDRRLSILHVIVSAGPTNAQYNEHCLPLAGERRIVICSFFKATVTPPPEIALYEGDGTFRGSLRALKAALDHDEYDVIHAHAPASAAMLLIANLLRRSSMANSVFTLHNSFQNYRLRNRLLLYPVVASYPSVVVCSGSAAQSLPALLQWLGRGKVTAVPNGVDTARVRRVLAGANGRPGGRGFTVVSVGRLIEIKDPLTLLRAFDRTHDSEDRLVFVGEGDLRPRLLGEVDRLALQAQVTLTGLVGRDDVYRHIARGDVFVSASRGEGLPVAVLEAMACGRPVILSDIPPHREIASDEEFVPLIRPDDVDGFAREIRRVKEMTPGQRIEIGDRCRRLVEGRFSLEGMHRSYRIIYRRVMRSHARRRPTSATASTTRRS